MKINQRQLKKWIRELYSGSWKQTRSVLQDDSGYCCLGVACELFIPKDKLELRKGGVMTGQFPHNQKNAPEWLKGINDDFKKRVGGYPSLDDLNDGKEFTFEEIADCLQLVYIHKMVDK